MIVPCDFSEVYYFANGKPYRWVTFYCVVAESSDTNCPISVTPFTNRSDMLDNIELAKECGVNAYTHLCSDICHESHYPELWKKICEYVSFTDND